ncbi:hypothetical protein ACFVUS_25625 [Nocardia sp. NPDC058058]|uniref:hypothetical protein n=1 Tax=Nocardia sp. NPDC058058 TaxID=3346317 RepID=UPI0036DF0052
MVYDAVTTHPAIDIRALLARSPIAPAAQRARLAADPSASIRLFVALGSITHQTSIEPLPDEAYAVLVADSSPVVRSAACMGWPDPPVTVLNRLLSDPDPRTRTVAAARSWRRLPQLLPLMATAREDVIHLWSEAIANALLDPGTIAALLSRDAWIRCVLAENPYLSTDIVARLAADQDPGVRMAVSMRREFSDRVQTAGGFKIGPAYEITPVFWASATTDPSLMHRAVKSTHVGLRRSAAYNPCLPPNLVKQLALDDDMIVRRILCETNPCAPADLLWNVLRENKSVACEHLITRPNFPTHRLRSLALSTHAYERCLVTRDHSAPAELIERLSYDTDPLVRRTAAGDTRLSMPRLLELVDDSTTSCGAALNPNLPVRIMESMLADAGVR